MASFLTMASALAAPSIRQHSAGISQEVYFFVNGDIVLDDVDNLIAALRVAAATARRRPTLTQLAPLLR
jgi:hypothetical protein